MYLILGTILTPLLVLFCIKNLQMVNLDLKYYVKSLIALIVEVAILISCGYEKFIMIAMLITLIGIIYLKERHVVISVITPILASIIFFLTDFINSNVILVYVLKISPKTIRSSHNLWLMILFYLSAFITAYIICHLIRLLLNKSVNLKEVNFKNKFNLFVLLNIILTFLIFYINGSILINVDTLSNTHLGLNSIMFILYFILLICICLAFSTNVKKEMEMNHKKVEFESLKEYTQNLESLYNEMRAFRHDYINILSSMISYMDENDMEGLRSYFETNIVSTGQKMEKGNFRLGKLQCINIPEIKGLVASKFIRAQELDIETFIDILEPINKINMDIIDLCRVLGILIDNGVEAALEAEKKDLKLALVNKKNSVVIVIINSCTKDMPSVHKIFERGFSTKGEGRGLGLNNLNTIINKYENVSLDTIIEDETFTQVIEILN